MTYLHEIPEDHLRVVVAASRTSTDALRRLGLSTGGGEHHQRFERKLEELGISTTHFVYHAAPTSCRKGGSRKALGEILVRGSTYNPRKLKKRLICEGVLEERCAECGVGPEWNGKPLVHQLDHISGDRSDQRLSNLRLLCPNCHSQTPTFAGRNKRGGAKGRKDSCPRCGRPKQRASQHCRQCSQRQQEITQWPSDDRLRELVWERPVSEVAKGLGVSGAAVKKRCRRVGIDTPPRGYWQRIRAGGSSPSAPATILSIERRL